MALLTQFSATRFSVNRSGARVRNNSLLKPGALLTSFQSVFQFLQIGPFNVKKKKKKKHAGKRRGRRKWENSVMVISTEKRNVRFLIYFVFRFRRTTHTGVSSFHFLFYFISRRLFVYLFRGMETRACFCSVHFPFVFIKLPLKTDTLNKIANKECLVETIRWKKSSIIHPLPIISVNDLVRLNQ